MRALSNILTLLKINVLTAICCIPIVTAGAALSSMHYMIMKMMDGDDGRVAKRYFEQMKGNLKSSTPVYLILLAIAVFLGFDYYVAMSQSESPSRIFLVPVIVGMIILFAIFVWIFPLLARFENTLSATFRNTAILAIGKLWRTLVMMALWFVIVFALSQSWRLLPLFFLFGLSLPGYFSALLYYPVLKEMIERVQGKSEEEIDIVESDAAESEEL